jgi:hypothetical protein
MKVFTNENRPADFLQGCCANSLQNGRECEQNVWVYELKKHQFKLTNSLAAELNDMLK